MKNLIICLSGILLMTLAACQSNSSSDNKNSTYNVTISGDINKSLKGDIALYSSSTTSGIQYFVIGIGSSDVSGSGQPGATNYLLISRYGDKPGTGSFQIMNIDQAGGSDFVATGMINGSILYNSESGTLNINNAGSNNLEGDFTIQAQAYQQNGNSTDTLNITVKGSFNAQMTQMSGTGN